MFVLRPVASCGRALGF